MKIFDYLHAEYPDFFVLNVHPGVFVDTTMGAKGKSQGVEFPTDDSTFCVSVRIDLMLIRAQLSFPHNLLCGP